MIKAGDTLPDGTVSEFIEVETAGCALGPNNFKSERSCQRQENRRVRFAGCIHAHLFRQTRPGLCE